MIKLTGIRKSYHVGGRPLEVLKGIDMHIDAGEIVSVMGSSGSGKSTLLNIIGILDNYDQGEYLLDGNRIINLSEKEAAHYRSRMLGFVFQSFNLVSFKNAVENVALPLYYQKVPRKERNKKAMEYLDMVGLKDWHDHMPNELSGGQKQRVAIARAMVSSPKVILADEPTGALDSITSKEVMEVLKHVNKEQGITLLIVTHEKDISEMCDRIILLKDGRIERDEKEVRSSVQIG